MKVHIVCYEDVNGWILGKIASRLCENLEALSVRCDISKRPDLSADINHHIIYYDYDGRRSTLDTVMITHINTDEALAKVRHQLQEAQMGFCFSSQTMQKLANRGIPRSRLCYVLPAHDEVMAPRPITIGLTSKVHNDGRKREWMLVELAQQISCRDFRFKIMGMGWEAIVAELRALGFDVEYFNAFDYELNQRLVPTFDYYLYFGLDEGAMGFIDALAAGVPTIVTPQGYHLDAENGISYPFTTGEELLSVFGEIAAQKRKLVGAVAKWTWHHYAQKHLEIWRHLLERGTPGYHRPAGRYRDGLSSVVDPDERGENADAALAALLNRVRAALDAADLIGAEAILQDTLARFPRAGSVYEVLHQIYTLRGEHERARKLIEAAKKSWLLDTPRGVVLR